MSRADRRRAEREGQRAIITRIGDIPPKPTPPKPPDPPDPPVANAVVSIPAWRSIEIPLVKLMLQIEQCGRYQFLLKWNDADIGRARSIIASIFLADCQPVDVLVMIDTDISFPLAALDTLVELAREKEGIAGGVLPVRSKTTWAAVRTLPGQPIDLGPDCPPREVCYIGAAFMAIHRSVLERLVVDLPDCRLGEIAHWPFFLQFVKPLGDGIHHEYHSEDYAFCARAREKGIPIWALTNFQLGHHGLYEYKISPTESYDSP